MPSVSQLCSREAGFVRCVESSHARAKEEKEEIIPTTVVKHTRTLCCTGATVHAYTANNHNPPTQEQEHTHSACPSSLSEDRIPSNITNPLTPLPPLPSHSNQPRESLRFPYSHTKHTHTRSHLYASMDDRPALGPCNLLKSLARRSAADDERIGLSLLPDSP